MVFAWIYLELGERNRGGVMIHVSPDFSPNPEWYLLEQCNNEMNTPNNLHVLAGPWASVTKTNCKLIWLISYNQSPTNLLLNNCRLLKYYTQQFKIPADYWGFTTSS